MGSGTRDRAEGKVDEVKGKAKEAFGRTTGDASTEGEGAVDQIAGKGKQVKGDLKNAGRKAKQGVKKAVGE
jgi:uncharacterized protein YjbJ (UPF0337 family)